MNIIKSDDRLVLKSSTLEQLKHSCIEFSVEKREQFSNIEYIIISISLLVAVCLCATSVSVICLKTGFAVLIVFISALKLSFNVYNESLLITAPIGLQLTTTYITGHQMVFSLPWESIAEVLIVDVIHTQKVLYYLAIKTHQNGLVILFQKSAPRLHFLEIIYNDVFKLLKNNE